MGELTADNPVAAETPAHDAMAGGAPTGNTADDAAVAAVRGFNRFYTNVIGLLRGKYLDTPYSLTEARLLFEMAQRDASEVPDLRRTVDIDPGYLSRILARFCLGRSHRQAAFGRGRPPAGHPADRHWPCRRGGAGCPVGRADPRHARRAAR